MKKIILYILVCLSFQVEAQTNLSDSCKLKFGTNLSALVDWSTELPFVDVMKICREWQTSNVAWVTGGANPWNSEVAHLVAKDTNGYPLEVPFFQNGLGLDTAQKIYTHWALNEAWEAGIYTLFYDGVGTFDVLGDGNIVSQIPGEIKVQVNPVANGGLTLAILSSSVNNHVRNMRFIMPGHETTYQSQPYNPSWLNKLSIFGTLRFMDWQHTNFWSQPDNWTWDFAPLVDWSERPRKDFYTWTTNKGVPYEAIIDLINNHNFDAWVCVPHRASNNYIQGMAQLFHTQLNPNKKLHIEYSNEIWNWLFGQTQWLNKYGCTNLSQPWPEGMVPYVQNCMDIWTNEYGADISRLNRVVSVQTSWQDVSNRIAHNMTANSFDALGTTYYFGLGANGDSVLDALGSAATVADVAALGRSDFQTVMSWLRDQKTQICDSLNIPMVFYEGGHHLTPDPFGVVPTYENALNGIMRDTSMYNMYNQWFDSLRSLQSGSEPLLGMNFSFCAPLSARYGSWGILERSNQDTSIIKAPKYQALIDNTFKGCNNPVGVQNVTTTNNDIKIYPNPANDILYVYSEKNIKGHLSVYDLTGKKIYVQRLSTAQHAFDVSHWTKGIYFLRINGETQHFSKTFIKE